MDGWVLLSGTVSTTVDTKLSDLFPEMVDVNKREKKGRGEWRGRPI